MATEALDGVVGVALEMCSSSAVTFCGTEHSLLPESVNSIMICVGWLAVAVCRPGPLTWHACLL